MLDTIKGGLGVLTSNKDRKKLEGWVEMLANNSPKLPTRIIEDQVLRAVPHFAYPIAGASLPPNPYYHKFLDIIHSDDQSTMLMFMSLLRTIVKHIVPDPILRPMITQVTCEFSLMPEKISRSPMSSFLDVAIISSLKFMRTISFSELNVKLSVYQTLDKLCEVKDTYNLYYDKTFQEYFHKTYQEEIMAVSQMFVGANLITMLGFLDSPKNTLESPDMPTVNSPDCIALLLKSDSATNPQNPLVTVLRSSVLTVLANLLLMKRLKYARLASPFVSSGPRLSLGRAVREIYPNYASSQLKVGDNYSFSQDISVTFTNPKNNQQLILVRDKLYFLLASPITSNTQTLVLKESLYKLTFAANRRDVMCNHFERESIYIRMDNDDQARELASQLHNAAEQIREKIVQSVLSTLAVLQSESDC